MTNSENTAPALAAILLAILFPLYWILELSVTGASLSGENYLPSLMWNYLDWIFLVLGVLSIYVFLELRRVLIDQLNYTGLDIPIFIHVAISIVFYFGLSIMNIALLIAGEEVALAYQEFVIGASLVVLLASIILTGVVEILMGCLLLRDSQLIPQSLKAFAIITLILGIFDLTILFSLASLFILPLSMIVLAAFFLYKPDMLEIV